MSNTQNTQAWKDSQPSINQHSSAGFKLATQIYLHIYWAITYHVQEWICIDVFVPQYKVLVSCKTGRFPQICTWDKAEQSARDWLANYCATKSLRAKGLRILTLSESPNSSKGRQYFLPCYRYNRISIREILLMSTCKRVSVAVFVQHRLWELMSSRHLTHWGKESICAINISYKSNASGQHSLLFTGNKLLS